jgi:hypothetical protein
MTDSPAPPSFSFTRAKPKEAGGLQEHPLPHSSAGTPVRRKRGPNKPKPVQETVSIKVDLAQAIAAAALLHEEDAGAFAAVVKTLNACTPAARKRISIVLGRIFG